MSSRRRLALAAVALAGAVTVSGCGGGDDAVSAGSGSGAHGSDHGSNHSGPDDEEPGEGDDADVAFLSGMIPHHEQAVEMSDIVLAANPPAEVVAIARQIQDAQAPEIEQMRTMLDALGAKEDSSGGHSAHGGAHGGMMTDAELAELKAATGTDAARLYLEAMIEHHEGAIEASDAQLADGSHAPALELAQQIKQAQAAEIATMKRLLASL